MERRNRSGSDQSLPDYSGTTGPYGRYYRFKRHNRTQLPDDPGGTQPSPRRLRYYRSGHRYYRWAVLPPSPTARYWRLRRKLPPAVLPPPERYYRLRPVLP